MQTYNPGEQSFKRVKQVFKFSPAHSRQIQIPQLTFHCINQSKYKPSQSPLSQLNKIFKHRKIGDSSQRPFFNDIDTSTDNARSKSKINQDIQHSIIYIQNLRKKRGFGDASRARARAREREREREKGSKQEDKKEEKDKKEESGDGGGESVLSAIGLRLPELEHRIKYRTRYLTEPSFSGTGPKSPTSGNSNQKLYSYLQRGFMDRKQEELSERKVINYAKNPNDRNFQRIMLQKSRKYIKRAVQNNFREVSRIGTVLNQESRKIIEEDITQKKKKYEKDYFVRYNVPYFSFLTLKDKEKESVLQSIRKKSLS